jgi:hypothetical protein
VIARVGRAMASRLLREPTAMRNLLTITAGLWAIAWASGCDSGPGAAKDPPVLRVTSPARGLLRGQAGALVVSGAVEPNPHGDPVTEVTVNDVAATLAADGSFTATISVGEGATLIETVAKDRAGTAAHDTRAVQAGALRAVGANLPSAVTAALSADAFAKLSTAAGPLIKGMNMAAMLAPLQPMVMFGGGCNGATATIDDLKFSDIKIALTPVQGGLTFRAEIDQLNVPAHTDYAVLCVSGSTSLRVTADKIVVAGTLTVTPNGMAGFTTKLTHPDVSVTGFHLDASGLAGTVIGWLHLDTAIQTIVATGAELAMNPLMNQALGALAGPQQLDVLGHKASVQVAPSAVSFTPAGAVIAMNMRFLLAGSEASPGFISTSDAAPQLDAGHGFQLGLADDLANELLAEAHALHLIDLTMPASGGTFDAAQVKMTLPPMISADATDGALRLILGDMIATYTLNGAPVVRAAINARLDLKIAPLTNGTSVAVQLGTPEIHVNVLDDLPNRSGIGEDSLARASAACLTAQIDALSKLLVAIPLPSVAGLQVGDLSIGSDAGYVLLQGKFL